MNFKLFFALLPFLVVFVLSLYPPTDADLGWHLKYGEYFFKHGQILKDNIFSTEMADFKWANSSWGTDLITYLTFASFGFIGLSVLGAAAVAATFYFFSKAAKLDFFEMALIFPILLLFLSPINSVSFRGQLLSLLLTGVLFYILSLYEEKKNRVIFLLVPLFVLWVNLHGQFLFGLILFYIWVAGYLGVLLLNTKSLPKVVKQVQNLILVGGLSILATLINPWGIRAYEVALTHFNNPDLKAIIEYLPFNELSIFWWNQVIIGFMLFFGILFIIFQDQSKQKIPWAGPLAILFALSFWVRRYSWSMYYLSMPILQPVAAFFRPDRERAANIAGTIIFGLVLGLGFWLGNPLQRIQSMSWQKYCQEYLACSAKSVEFLAQKKYPGQLMSLYNWGGWMIWNYPEVKPSIDGRMHLWRDAEGYSAFSQYYPIEQNLVDIDQSKYDVVLMSPQKPVYEHLQYLSSVGKWQKVYEDEWAGIFTRVLK